MTFPGFSWPYEPCYKHQNFYSCLFSEGFWEVCSYMISLIFHCTLSKSAGLWVFSQNEFLSPGACDVKSHSLVSKRRGELTVLAAVFVVSVDERYSRVAPLVRAQALHGHEHAVTHAAWMPRNHSLLLQRSNHRLRFHGHRLLRLQWVSIHSNHILYVTVGDSIHGSSNRHLRCFLLSEEMTDVTPNLQDVLHCDIIFI